LLILLRPHVLQVFNRVRIRTRYLQKDFLLDFIGTLPLDLLLLHTVRQAYIPVLRILRLLHARKLYRQVRQGEEERAVRGQE